VNVVTAVVFNAFTMAKQETKTKRDKVRVGAMENAWEMLVQIGGKPGQFSCALMDDLARELTHYNEILYIDVDVLRKHLEGLDDDGDGLICKAEFKQIVQVLRKSGLHDFRPPWLETQIKTLKDNASWQSLKRWVSSETWNHGIDVMLIISIGLAFAESCQLGLLQPKSEREVITDESKSNQGLFYSFAFWNLIFTSLFMLEMTLKIMVYGFERYWSRMMNKFDFLITIGTLAITLIVLMPNSFNSPSAIRLAAMFRVGRITRLMFHVSAQFNIMANTLFVIVPEATSILKVLMIAMFTFSFMGVQLFGGKINTDPASPYSEPVSQTDYGSSNYYANNFNDIPSGMVTLFELIVVNNWFEIVDGFSAAIGNPYLAATYFVLWYVFGVLIVMNIVVSFVLNAFVDKYEQHTLEIKQGRKDTANVDEDAADEVDHDEDPHTDHIGDSFG